MTEFHQRRRNIDTTCIALTGRLDPVQGSVGFASNRHCIYEMFQVPLSVPTLSRMRIRRRDSGKPNALPPDFQGYVIDDARLSDELQGLAGERGHGRRKQRGQQYGDCKPAGLWNRELAHDDFA